MQFVESRHALAARLVLLLTGMFALAGTAASAAPAVATSAPGKNAATVEEVQGLHDKLGRVLRTKLPKPLQVQAQHVETDAAAALAAASSAGGAANKSVALEGVVREYKDFIGQLLHQETNLRGGAAVSGGGSATGRSSAATVAKAAALLPGLEKRVRTVMGHIQADTRGLNEADTAIRGPLLVRLEQALAPTGPNATVLDRAVTLHNALVAAHDYQGRRAVELGAEETRLASEIEDGQARLLYMMLRQRRRLNKRSQMALLRRPQFANCTWAQKLLAAAAASPNGPPLWEQLRQLLPARLSGSYGSNATRKDDPLAAVGSDGRVHVVSSRLKNTVTMMSRELKAARMRLEQVVSGASGAGPAERRQAKEVAAGLDELLGKVDGSHDLKQQLETLEQVQGKLAGWIRNATAQ